MDQAKKEIMKPYHIKVAYERINSFSIQALT